MDEIFDPIRKIFVKKTKEEIVRQKLIFKMTKNLFFPKSLIAVEKDVFTLSYLKNLNTDIKRRADIIAFAKKDLNLIYPLVLIECKAVKLNNKVIEQVLGYNYYIQALFVTVANEDEIKTLYVQNNKIKTIDFLPSYKDLIKAINEK